MSNVLGFAMVHDMVLERWVRDNYDGTVDFEPPTIVKCFKEDNNQRILNSRGEERVSRACYFTLERVTDKDKIDGELVLRAGGYNILGVKYYRSFT